jgi:multiple sugar transport system permease protein
MASTASTRPVASTRGWGGMRNRNRFWLIVRYILLIVVALIVLIPIIWMLSTSFKPKSQWFARTVEWIPRTFTLDNYTRILNNRTTPIGLWFWNSLLLGTITTVLTLVVDALAAYAYARLQFPGRRVLFALLLSTLFLPGVMFLVPNFITVFRLGMLNSFPGVFLPAIASVFGVFFLRQFFETIPKELEEAAQIDGASTFQTFWMVVLPLAQPALATLAVITFLASWNDFLWPLLILQDRALQTLPPGLRTLQGAYTSEYGQMMAGAAIAAVPVLILYIFTQRYIVQSVATTGLKG